MERLILNNKLFPPELKLFHGRDLKTKMKIDNFKITCDSVVDELEINIFQKIFIKRAVNLFEGEIVEFKEQKTK